MVAAFEAVVTVASVVDELVVVEVVAAFDAVVSVADGLVAVDAAVVAVGVAASSDLHDLNCSKRKNMLQADGEY